MFLAAPEANASQPLKRKAGHTVAKKKMAVSTDPAPVAAKVDTPAPLPTPYFTANGQAVFKISFGKFVWVKAIEGTPWILFGEWKNDAGKWVETVEKTVAISLDQFMILSGRILDGDADCPRELVSSEPHLLNLHDGLFFSWSRYCGTPVANLRFYFIGKNGDLRPSKKGITINSKGFELLKEFIGTFAILKQAAMLEDRPEREGLKAPGLLEYLTSNCREIILNARLTKIKEQPGTLVNEPITEAELVAAVGSLQKTRKAEAFVLETLAVTAKQFLSLDFVAFYGKCVGHLKDRILKK